MLNMRFVVDGKEIKAQDMTVNYSPNHQHFSFQDLTADVYLTDSDESFTTNGLVTLKDGIVFISPLPRTEP